MRREPSDVVPIPLILSFHQVQDHISFGVTNYRPRRFFHLLSFLRDRGFKFASVAAVLSEPRANRIAICFDDGYQHLLDVLPRVIDEFAASPMVFVPTAYVGRYNEWDYGHKIHPVRHLHEGEVRQLSRAGVEFGSHGHSHVSLVGLEPKELEHELVRSKRGLEELTGLSITSISYPFGRVNGSVIEAAHRARYQYGFTMRYPSPNDPRQAVGRMAVYAFDTPFSVLQKLTPGPMRVIEKVKGKIVNSLAGGTIFLNRIRR